MSKGPGDRTFHLEEVVVQLDGNGDSVLDVTFPRPFENGLPIVHPIPLLGSEADLAAKDITQSGFKLHIGETAPVGGSGGQSEVLISQKVKYGYFATERW